MAVGLGAARSVIAAAALLASAACTGPDQPEPTNLLSDTVAATTPSEPMTLENVWLSEPGTLVRLQTGFIGDSDRGELCDNAAESALPQCQLVTLQITGLPIEEFDLHENEGVSSGQVDIIAVVLDGNSEFDVAYVGRPAK